MAEDRFSSTEDPELSLKTGEVVSLRVNHEIFDTNGQLKKEAKFSANSDSQLLTIHWQEAGKNVSTLSTWQLAFTKATDDDIASFLSKTAEKVGLNKWEAVKKVAGQCRAQFQARLISMSSQKLVFAHDDQQSADKMKVSNETLDIMSVLISDAEESCPDVVSDWEVNVRSLAMSLSYPPMKEVSYPPLEEVSYPPLEEVSYPSMKDMDKEDADRESVLVPNGDNFSFLQHSLTSGKPEEFPPHFQQLLDILVSENLKTQTALARMAEENEERHYVLCQKIEELQVALQNSNAGHGNMPINQSRKTAEENESLNSVRRDQYVHDRRQQPSGYNARSQSNSFRTQPSTTRYLQREDSTRPSDAIQDSVSYSEQENQNLDEAVERAYRHDDTPPPMAKSFYTILCLDVSESMKKHGAFEEMKEIVSGFINGVEDCVDESSVEENIGVVTFGGTSTVVQNLTNDFSRVRDVIDNITLGGRSPFVQALLVSMAAFVEKGGIISVGGVYEVRPRIIFISDGYPTENLDDGGMDCAYDKAHVRTALTKLMMSFATKDKYKSVHPVIYVPVGQNADIELMKSMATLSEGQFVMPKDVHKLCGYFMVQEAIGKILACIKTSDHECSDESIRALTSSIMPNLDDEQKDEVMEVVKKELQTPSSHRPHRRTSDFDDMYEDTEKVNAGEKLPLGTRVLRGPDWHWKDQDGNGPGTVFSHARDGWTYVAWDVKGKGYNRYGYGPDMGYDIWKTNEHPRLMGEDQKMKIGMVVEKGPDWCYTQQNLRNVRTGVVIRKSRTQKKLMVRWDNGELQVVRWGSKNKYDVVYCDPTQLPQEAPLEFLSSKATIDPGHFLKQEKAPFPPVGSDPDTASSMSTFEHGRWQFTDEFGMWKDYSPGLSATIEKTYKKRPEGSCVVVRDGINRRIMFRRMTEKETASGAEHAVRRIPA